MSLPNKCLNCNFETNSNFCSNCGQKTNIHRITFKHFIFHDVLHGLFHFDKGMLFTAKESLIRPGKAAIDYIEGKRIRYYNVFYLILLLIGLNIFLSSYYDNLSEIYNPKINERVSNALGEKIEQFFSDYAKIIIFSFVPLFAINGYVLFRKRKLNLSEHFIIAGITFLGILLVITFNSIISFLDFTNYLNTISNIVSFVSVLAILFLPINSYYQAFKEYYNKKYFTIRILLFSFLLLFELVLLVILIIGIVSNWKFK
jgi:hypothetical protein